MTRFAVREAKLSDAEAIAAAHTESWQTSYRGILPDDVLDRIDVGQRADSRRKILQNKRIYQLVAYDVTHGDIVGFCDAGESRRPGPPEWSEAGGGPRARPMGEIYALYMVHRAKRMGLGQEMFERCQSYFAAQGTRSLIIWVLEHNTHARGFYEAMGGKLGPTFPSRVGGFPVVEVAYVWDRF